MGTPRALTEARRHPFSIDLEMKEVAAEEVATERITRRSQGAVAQTVGVARRWAQRPDEHELQGGGGFFTSNVACRSMGGGENHRRHHRLQQSGKRRIRLL